MALVKSLKAKKAAMIVLLMCGVVIVASELYPGWSNQRPFVKWFYGLMGAGAMFLAVYQWFALRKVSEAKSNG